MNRTFTSEVWHRLASQHVRRTNAMKVQDLHFPRLSCTVLVRMQRMLPWFRWFQVSISFQCAALVPSESSFLFISRFPSPGIIRYLMALFVRALPSMLFLQTQGCFDFLWLSNVLKSCSQDFAAFYCFCNTSIFAYPLPPFQFTGLRSCTSRNQKHLVAWHWLVLSNGRNWQDYDENCGSIAAEFPFASGSLKTLHLLQCS